MYFLNPVVFFAGVMLLLTLLTLLWRRLSRSEPMRQAAGALTRVSVMWFAVMLVLGLVMGLNHSKTYPACQERRAADPNVQNCQYFFDHFDPK